MNVSFFTHQTTLSGLPLSLSSCSLKVMSSPSIPDTLVTPAPAANLGALCLPLSSEQTRIILTSKFFKIQ